MGLKVGLVFPGISLLGFGSYGKAVDATWVHHGLCMLSACAKQAGHDVKLFDMRQLASYRDLVTRMTAYAPQVVGISSMSADFAIAAKTARLLKCHHHRWARVHLQLQLLPARGARNLRQARPTSHREQRHRRDRLGHAGTAHWKLDVP